MLKKQQRGNYRICITILLSVHITQFIESKTKFYNTALLCIP
ncbi:hypothetical protein [Helicobacter jaachi]|nr:hypothetical protein [Helicobacter jaachi]